MRLIGNIIKIAKLLLGMVILSTLVYLYAPLDNEVREIMAPFSEKVIEVIDKEVS